MYLEKIAIFILFLTPLVFFHELGHYLFARLFGVRVEVFSLGFGPKLFKFKRHATEYVISLIPLGGYIKMFGDDPFNKDQVPKEERPYSFSHKGKWARFWIVFGGPLANFILTYFIFFTLLSIGEQYPQVKLGTVSPDSVFYQKGIRTGDVIEKVGPKEVLNHSDIAFTGEALISTITVRRHGERHELPMDMPRREFTKNFMKHPPLLRRPLLIDDRGQKYILSSSPTGADLETSLSEIQSSMSASATAVTVYLYNYNYKHETKGEDGKQKQRPSKILPMEQNWDAFLKKHSLRPLDLAVKSVREKSAAHKAGLKDDDIIIALEGRPIYSFQQLRTHLQKTKKEEIPIVVWREGNTREFLVRPETSTNNGKKVKLIGVYGQGEFLKVPFTQAKPKGLITAFILAFGRTWDAIAKTADGFKKLITNEISFKNIGGPLTIGKFASDSFNTNLFHFFQLMALISVNLGLINLFPIPILDGGHIMFIALEILNRGPISRRKMEIAQQLGLSLLLMLMVGALFNDFSRFF